MKLTVTDKLDGKSTKHKFPRPFRFQKYNVIKIAKKSLWVAMLATLVAVILKLIQIIFCFILIFNQLMCCIFNLMCELTPFSYIMTLALSGCVPWHCYIEGFPSSCTILWEQCLFISTTTTQQVLLLLTISVRFVVQQQCWLSNKQ